MFDTNEIDATSYVDQQVNENELDQASHTETADQVDIGTQETAESSEPQINSLDDALKAALQSHQQKVNPLPAERPALKEGQAFDSVNDRILEPIKAPGSLTPALRETWAAVPRDFQQFWSDRERDMSKTMQETAAARKGWAEFNEIVKPFEQQLANGGFTAASYTKELYKTAEVLWHGTPQEKAQVIVTLLQRHQPDPATLQALLAGQTPPPAQPRINVREEVETMFREREEQRQASDAEGALAAFAADPANEFFGDVKDWMGKAIEGGLVEGNTMPELLKNAYDFAVKNHPNVAPVVAQRTAARPASQAAARPVARPNGQIKPGLTGARTSATTGAAPEINSLDDAIKAARASLAG